MKIERCKGQPDIIHLKNFAQQLRRDALHMIYNAKSGHIGGSLGIAEYVAALYGYVMESDSENPLDPDRDRFVLSNGHTCATYYAALARNEHIPLSELATFRKMGSRLQGHPSRVALSPFVETSTGPLGQGFSVANGIALSIKQRASKARVYCILGDGEMQEGQVWEAFMTASHYHLSNMTVLINNNHLQIDGTVKEVMNLDNLVSRLSSFGWNVLEIDGNDMEQVVTALRAAVDYKDGPTVILGNTLMGKGVPFMEDLASWHGTCPTQEQTIEALKSVGCNDEYHDCKEFVK